MGNDLDRTDRPALLTAALLALLSVTGAMLLSLVTQTPPHPPNEVVLFALGPFLGASLAIGLAALPLVQRDLPSGAILALLFAATGLLSFGPQKYLDPAFSRIWPAVLTAQAAILVLVWLGVLRLRNRAKVGRRADAAGTAS